MAAGAGVPSLAQVPFPLRAMRGRPALRVSGLILEGAAGKARQPAGGQHSGPRHRVHSDRLLSAETSPVTEPGHLPSPPIGWHTAGPGVLHLTHKHVHISVSSHSSSDTPGTDFLPHFLARTFPFPWEAAWPGFHSKPRTLLLTALRAPVSSPTCSLTLGQGADTVGLSQPGF